MIDKKKLMSDLEGLTFDDWHMYHCDTDVQGIAIDALEFMKEQEQAHAQKREFASMWFWVCGSCGVAITEGDKFCRNCGKKVKWDE